MKAMAVETRGGVMKKGFSFCALSAIFLQASFSIAQQVPANFEIKNAAPRNGLSEPTSLAFFPDGRLLVGTKKGKVFVIENGAMSSTPFIDLTGEVLSNEANGLMDVAVDPDYPSAPWVYVLYVVDPTGGADDDSMAFSRLTRYKSSSSNPNVADLSSRQILIGQTWGQGWPACSGQHVVGTIRFAKDKTLLAGSGESSQRPGADAGGRDPECASHYPADHDIGAYRAQHLGSLSGKIIRIDRNTGNGLPSNPYYTGNASENQSRVWAYGLRNPFRFAIRPNGSTNPADGRPGTLYIGDVGWGEYEEVDIAKGGENFGWPCYEGPVNQTNYRRTQPSHHNCSSIGSSVNPAPHTPPSLYWHHREGIKSNPQNLLGACVMAGTFYTGNRYPAQYRHAFFVVDYEADWLKVAPVDANDNVTNLIDFATGIIGMADMEADPITGDLFYADVDLHLVKKITYSGPVENAPPVAAVSATPNSGPSPLSVQFSSAGSFDPEGGAITYTWNFGDGGSSTQANPQHTYNTQGNYNAVLTVRDPQGLTGASSVTITVNNTADTTPPAISGVSATNITSDAVMIQWTTNEPANSRVDYGPTTSYGTSTPVDATLLTDHSAPLGNLSASTTYHYRVRSADAAGNVAFSSDFTFSTTSSSFMISGKVVNATNNQPIAGARVGLQAKGNPVITDASGNFTMSNVPGVGSTITAAKEMFYTGVETVNDANTLLTISLDPIVFETNRNYTFVEPAVCSRCHDQQVSRWTNSPMNQAGMNIWVHDLYSGTGTPGGMNGFVYTRDSVHRIARPNAECAACHNPTEWVKNPHNVNMGDINNPTDGMLKGVQCEICHRIFEKDPNKINTPGLDPDAVTFVMPSAAAPLQFGALGDAFVSGSLVMRPAYNPRLRNNMCATCHEDNNDHDDDGDYEEPGSVSVEPTYEEWKASPYAVPGPNYKDCVDCHMPPYGFDYFCSEAQIPRDPNTIRSHDIRGTTPGFLENAVTMTTTTQLLSDRLRVRVRINNDQTGHHVPTGVGVRNMILLVEAKSQNTGAPLNYIGMQAVHALGGEGNPQQGYYAGLPGKLYAKSHSDGRNDGVFYTEATTISWDNRIPALQSDETTYDFALPAGGGTVQATSKLIYRRAFRNIIDAKGWTTTGHGAPLPDIQPPYYGHLMESNTVTVNLSSGGGGFALKFDGANDYLQISDNALLSGGAGKNITVEAWVKPDQVNGVRPVVEKFLDGKTKDWGVQIVDSQLEAVIESSGDDWNLQGGSVPAGTWTHLAFTFDNAANLVRAFVNGAEVGQRGLDKDMPDTSAPLRVGRHGYATQYFAGEIDEIRIWSFARSAGQIGADMNRQLSGAEAGLIAYWQFNEGSGQVAADKTANGNNWRLGNSTGSDSNDPAWLASTAPIGSTPATPAPSITSFAPASGVTGTVITITGANFTGATSVKFNGVAAAFTVNSATQINATVPAGASSGKLSVTAPGGTAQSASDFTVTTGGGSTTVIFNPRHDTFVKSSSPTTNYGTGTTMRQRKTASETMTSYLKFDVSGLTGPAQSAKIRLKVTDASNDGGGVYVVSNNYLGTSTAWTQTGLKWNNAPAISGTALSSVGAVSVGSWVEFDVTSAITGNGSYSFGLKNNSSDVVQYNTKEATNRPELLIQGVFTALASYADQEDMSDVAALPENFGLYQNYPNPFNPETSIEFDLPKTVSVRLIIYDILGREVSRLVDEERPAGRHSVLWDGRDENGLRVSSGIYFYSLQAGEFRAARKMLLVQ
jgi:glucose/arabinose dehydrogenase/PKD repeat protein